MPDDYIPLPDPNDSYAQFLDGSQEVIWTDDLKDEDNPWLNRLRRPEDDAMAAEIQAALYGLKLSLKDEEKAIETMESQPPSSSLVKRKRVSFADSAIDDVGCSSPIKLRRTLTKPTAVDKQSSGFRNSSSGDTFGEPVSPAKIEPEYKAKGTNICVWKQYVDHVATSNSKSVGTGDDDFKAHDINEVCAVGWHKIENHVIWHVKWTGSTVDKMTWKISDVLALFGDDDDDVWTMGMKQDEKEILRSLKNEEEEEETRKQYHLELQNLLSL